MVISFKTFATKRRVAKWTIGWMSQWVNGKGVTQSNYIRGVFGDGAAKGRNKYH